MKRIFTVLSAVSLSVSLWAQGQQKLRYQLVIRNESNSLITNNSVAMKISILQGSENGTVVYEETHASRTNDNGLASLSIGAGKTLSGEFTKIDWSKGPNFVKTETDVTGGVNYSLTTVSELISVPYALNSGNGIKNVSATGDTLNLTNGNFLIIPGISSSQPKPTSGSGPNITDVDGNTYKTVYIGTQQWMGENLKVSKYSDGTNFPNITDNKQWQKNITGAWSYYKNDDANNEKYGKLYNWYAVSRTSNTNKNVCPTGWHVPTDVEWKVLTDYLGGESEAGSKMKEVGTMNWSTPNSDATNMTMFTGLPGGIRNNNGDFSNNGDFGNFWSSSELNAGNAWYRYLGTSFGDANRNNNAKLTGMSIRCIRD